MKKFGKYEKMRKNAIMKTYVTSLLCLVLCVSMFFGTSFAWFTSEVNNTNNEIYIGTLDVDLFKDNGLDSEGKTIWADLASSDTNKVNLFDGNIRWEPGYTTLETIKIVNKGDLAFNYRLTLTNGEIKNVTSADEATLELLMKVAQNFVVYVHNGDFTAEDKKPGEFKNIVESDKWAPVMNGDEVATLADILVNGIPVLTGSMDSTEVRGPVVTNPTVPGPNDSEATEDTFIIALHMKEETKDPEIMGHIISLNVKLIAYQMASEQDDLNSNYDQMVATEEELKEAVANGGNVVLADDIKLTDTLTVASDVALDLNGYVLSGTCNAGQAHLIMVNNGATLDIKDSSSAKSGKITYAQGSSNTGWAIDLEGELNLYSGTIELIGESWDIAYCVDVRPNAWGTNYTEDTVFTMYGGKLVSSFDGIRVASSSSDTYGNIVASFVMNGGTIDAARDGIFMQQSNEAYDTLSVEINNGTVKGTRPIRVYGPNATSVNAGTAKAMTITAKAASLELVGALDTTYDWHTEGKIAYRGGMTLENLNQYATITLN